MKPTNFQEFNINGQIKVEMPPSVSPETATDVALALIRKQLNQTLVCEKTGVRVVLHESNVWGEHGSVDVGNLLFEVLHEPEKNQSGARVAITPVPGEFGSGCLTAMVTAYISPHCVFLNCYDANSNTEETVFSLGFEDGVLKVDLVGAPPGEGARFHLKKQQALPRLTSRKN